MIAPLRLSDARRSPRVKISEPVHLRPSDTEYGEEVRTTLNASRDGLYFTTWAEHYYEGMRMLVTFPYCSWNDRLNTQYLAEVLRVERLSAGNFGVAVRLLMR